MNTLLQVASGPDGGTIIIFLIILAFVLAVIYALRGVILWYYKISEILDNQKKQINLQKETNQLLSEILDKFNRS